MQIVVLGSGSKGNSTLLIDKNKKILIDVGFSYPKMKSLLEQYNLKPSDITDILVTHTHKDHVLGLSTFVKKNFVKVYANTILYKELAHEICEDKLCLVDDEFMIDDLNLELVHTSHDAVGSVGFVINLQDKSLVYITDTGYINENNFNKLMNKEVYILESNHDIEMLMNGPYPYILKQRVVGDKGHLSNELAGNYLHDFIGNNTKKIILAHLSETNNTEELALKTVHGILEDKLGDITITVARQNESLNIGEL